MQAIRHIFEHAPEAIPVPEQWRQKRMEVILLGPETEESVPNVTYGWPADYFERTFGSIPDLMEREAQGVAELES
ncbi:MAG: hypothetical protein H7832_01260 [Magnetococcus sp. DMHC-6]